MSSHWWHVCSAVPFLRSLQEPHGCEQAGVLCGSVTRWVTPGGDGSDKSRTFTSLDWLVMLSLMPTMPWGGSGTALTAGTGRGLCLSVLQCCGRTSSPMYSIECHNINRTPKGGPQGWQRYGREALEEQLRSLRLSNMEETEGTLWSSTSS